MIFSDLLRIIPNPDCLRQCSKDARIVIAENDICNGAVSVDDLLPLRCVGEWAIQKIYFLIQYFGIFSNAMKYKWGGKLNYIEICSGPGRCINRTTGEEFNGTALSIIEHPAFANLKKALFIDFDEVVINALNARIKNRGILNADAIIADYYDDTDICSKIKNKISIDGLNLVFIDPTDCSVPFQLVKSLKDNFRSSDLIINIASGTDFNRNVGNVLMKPTQFSKIKEKYNRFLDFNGFFEDSGNKEVAILGDNQELRNRFRESYIQNLKKIGYKFFELNSVKNYYDILFATEHEKGLELWKKATAIRFDGQRKLF